MKIGTENRLPPSWCLNCGKMNDAALCIGADGTPSPGDVTACIVCGHIMLFADDLTLRNPTDSEIYDIAGDRRIIAIQRARKN